jgi:DNA polymerase III subunit gamma/tau
MTYQVLARKWRPKTFQDMAGQEHVLQTLVHALDNKRLHHAYLFTGTRGVGKTTIARIFAKCLNCEGGVTSIPCGKCDACNEIAEGRFIDLIEVDAASKTKVEDTRELLDNVQYAPSRGRYKVYLIDEVHMLSTHSFNALLKTLEEPPPHVVFLLATTDPHKLPVTILSRCLQFSLKNLSPQKIVEYLQSVLIAEQIPFADGALWQLARAAQGSMRDALTLLDQSISFCGGTINEADVSALLGTPDQALLQQIMNALHVGDAIKMLEVAGYTADHSGDFFALLDNLLALIHRIAIGQMVPGGIDNSLGDREQVLEIAKKLTAEEVQLYYQIALNGRRDIALAPDPRMAFEMILMRMVAFKPTQWAGNAEAKGESPTLPSVVMHSSMAPTPAEDEKKKTEVSSAAPVICAALTTAPLQVPAVPAAEAEIHLPAAETEANVPVLDRADETKLSVFSLLEIDNWHAFFERLNLTGITRNLLANCIVEEIQEPHLAILLDVQQSALLNDEHRQRINQSLRDVLGTHWQISLRIGELTHESPARRKQRIMDERVEKALADFHADSNVRHLVDRFSASVVPESINFISEKRDDRLQ